MKERPILMSAPMVRALLAGTKTQTRRVAPIDRLDIKDHGDGFVSWAVGFTKPIGKSRTVGSHSGSLVTVDQARRIIASQFCPYGQLGDRLWVRETWAYGIHALASKLYEQEGPWVYAADNLGTQGRLCDRWRPSIHMFRAASRITLEVTAVRVERLQDIIEADAIAEGIVKLADGGYGLPDGSHYHATDPRISYLSLWGAINGQESVDANPFVWVIQYKRIAQ